MKPYARSILAVFSGAIATLSFAPFGIWPFAILSPLCLLLLLSNQTKKAATGLGFLWGVGQFGTGIYWVHVSIDNFGGMPKIASIFLMVLLISYLSIYPALFGLALNKYFPKNNRRRLLLAAPILWLISDWLRGWVMTGFPWLWLGYSQIDSPLRAFAPVSGVESITLMILIIAGSLAYGLIQKRWQSLFIPVCIFMTSFILMQISWVKPDPKTQTKFALIQGNIPQDLKWKQSQRWPTLMHYTDLTRENWDADVVIWPEAAIPAIEWQIPSFLENLDQTAKENKTGLITGVINQTPTGQFYNSVISLGQNKQGPYNYDTQARYHKHHLLPFGEFVPFGDLLRPLAPFFNLPMSSFSRGDFIQPNIESNMRYFVTALCYEIIFSQQVRQNVTDETNFILTLSNDAWFGDSIGPLQHFEIARMRALELGKPLIRATNNGVTGIADYQGKIIKTVPQFETKVLTADIMSTQGQTPYRYLGVNLLYLWGLFALMFNFLYQRKRK